MPGPRGAGILPAAFLNTLITTQQALPHRVQRALAYR